MRHLWKASAVALFAAATLAPNLSAAPPQRRFHNNGPRVVIRGGFGYPAYPGYYRGFYRSYDPFWDPFYRPGYVYRAPAPTTGDLKIKTPTPLKHASVYIDGGFVGEAHDVGKLPLAPGTHTVELRDSDGTTVYEQKVTVVLGKTTEIKPLVNS